ncbi:MAG: zinc-dependent alcohol dehydrogenase [Candidatus Humimicrobiaceae bacterium]
MKALVITAPGEIQIIETDKPKAGPKDVVVKVVYSGICGTDISILKGELSFIRDGLIKYPVRIGHEWSGIVSEVGDEVKDFKPGDRVVGDAGVSCGKCEHCLNGRYELCEYVKSVGTINTWDGSFAEYILMPFWHLHKLPDNISLEEASLIEPCTIALHGLKESNINRTSNVLVVGTGAIGLAAVSMVKIMGAARVLLSGRKPFKLDTGKAMGADDVVNVTNEELKDFIMRHTNGKGINIIIETSGNIETINNCMEIIAPNGIFCLIGFYEAYLNNFNIDKLVVTGIQVKGIAGSVGLIPEIISMMASGKLNVKPMITHRFKFSQAVEAIKTAREKNDAKIKMLIEMAEI